jgi:hypothetical protein
VRVARAARPVGAIQALMPQGSGRWAGAFPSRLIPFYVKAHNEVAPHSAFQGQTPDEVFFGWSAALR